MKMSMPRVLPLLALLPLAAMAAPAAAFQLLTGPDYLAISVEAEDGQSIDDRWVLTEPDTPQQLNDPDPNHASTASGKAYLELLPDIRITHDDPLPPTAFWPTAGEGPQASYPIDFVEAGRYYLHVRAFSTGSEDNGIHFGLNDHWPRSGAEVQLCQGGSWQWTSRKRYSGGNACGVPNTLWLDVPTPGLHTVQISAREDGFQLDEFMLVKDLSNNTRICSPANESSVTCRNGSIEQPDDQVDLTATLTTSVDPEEGSDDTATGMQGEPVAVSVEIRNKDLFDISVGGELRVDLDARWVVSDLDEACALAGNKLTCNFGRLPPSIDELNGPTFNFTLVAADTGALSVDATVVADDVDAKPFNDSDELVVEVVEQVLDTDVSIRSQSVPLTLGNYDRLSFTVTNEGEHQARGVVVELSIPSSLGVRLPAACEGGATLRCPVMNLAPGSAYEMSLLLSPLNEGNHALSVSVRADNDTVAVNNTVLLTLVASAPVDTKPDPVEPTAPAPPAVPDQSANPPVNPAPSEPVSELVVLKKDSGGGAFSVLLLLMASFVLWVRRL